MGIILSDVYTGSISDSEITKKQKVCQIKLKIITFQNLSESLERVYILYSLTFV